MYQHLKRKHGILDNSEKSQETKEKLNDLKNRHDIIKGQLISQCSFGVTKLTTKFCKDVCPSLSDEVKSKCITALVEDLEI
jgi:hypothetical protein